MSKKLLIIGGASLVGSTIIDYATDDYEIFTTENNTPITNPKVSSIKVNLLDEKKQILDYIEKIEFFISEHLNQMLKDPMKYKLLAREFSDLGLSSRAIPALAIPSVGLMEQNLSQVVDLIDQAKKGGEIIEDTDSGLLAYQLLSPNLTYITHQNLIDSVFKGLGPSSNDDFSKIMTTNLLRGVKRND